MNYYTRHITSVKGLAAPNKVSSLPIETPPPQCIVQNDKLYRVRLGSVELVALSRISQYVIMEMELKVDSHLMLVDIYC